MMGREARHPVTAEGPGRETAGVQRRCIVSGEVKPTSDMLRFVAAPDGSVVPDLDRKLPGRGLWLSGRRDMVETATRKNAFSRAARQKLSAAPDLAERVEQLLRERCLARLGFARRAGLVVAGFDKVRSQARKHGVAVLFEAAEGAAGGRRKVEALAPQARVVDWFSGADLAHVLGREHVVHVAVAPGDAAQRPLVAHLQDELDRLARYAGLGDGRIPPP